ncbi:hypothetical protein LCGC14_2948690 [marine sediment metagenome]|uniref:PARP-type domain-containing protein n=1 Tax=marine sediment metagenome TaxID=412755 RepID=A0A0F8Y339_9ZZZZ
MQVNVNLKSKHGGSVDCHLETCLYGGQVEPGKAMFALARNTPKPPYDEMETVWFHPKCFLIWCLMAVEDNRGLDKESLELLEWLKTTEVLIHV